MKVSIVMSCFDRSHLLRHSLGSIHRQKTQHQVEVVVVNDGLSNDGTEDVCKEFSDRMNVKYIFSGHRNVNGLVSRNPCIPNNIAVRQCSGDILILSCPEIYHVNNVIEYLVAPLVRNNRALTTTNGLYCDEHNNMIAELPRINLKNAVFYPSRSRYPFCMGMLKTAFVSIGGYDEDFADVYGAEDDDLISRLTRGGKSIRTTQATVVHLWHKCCKEYIPDAVERRARAKQMYYSKKAQPIYRNAGREWGKL